jgi:Zn finger protein HypA/HybF involved in hydrogenase expression
LVREGILVDMQKDGRRCIECNKILTTRHQIRYCSNKCQLNRRYTINISQWKKNNNDQRYLTKNISGYIKRYLIEKSGEKCSNCGWKKINPVTLRVPLEVDHVDGDSTNNVESNLRLVCPNCHSLSSNFRNLNIGQGRKWRTKKKI